MEEGEGRERKSCVQPKGRGARTKPISQRIHITLFFTDNAH